MSTTDHFAALAHVGMMLIAISSGMPPAKPSDNNTSMVGCMYSGRFGGGGVCVSDCVCANSVCVFGTHEEYMACILIDGYERTYGGWVAIDVQSVFFPSVIRGGIASK